MVIVQNESFNAEALTKKEISNPQVFIEKFRDSDAYKEELSKFFNGKKLSDEVTEEDKTNAFESYESGRKTLIEFAKNYDEILSYSPDEYSKKIQETVSDYFGHLYDYQRGRFAEKDLLNVADTLRGQYHDATADVLAEELGISHKLARGLIQLMSINKGLETFDSASQDERRRLRAMFN